METLADAENRELIAPESRMMLEGVLRMADMTAGDVMVAAPHMDMLEIGADYVALLYTVINTAHSRFPVYENQRDNIIGILMAKDLLKLQRSPELNLRTLAAPGGFCSRIEGPERTCCEISAPTAATWRSSSTNSAAPPA